MGIARMLVGGVVTILEVLLSLRFIFKFFVANAQNSFVVWVYDTTASLVSPFSGIISNLKLGDFVIDFATLIALIVYVSVGYFVLRIFSGSNSQI